MLHARGMLGWNVQVEDQSTCAYLYRCNISALEARLLSLSFIGEQASTMCFIHNSHICLCRRQVHLQAETVLAWAQHVC